MRIFAVGTKILRGGGLANIWGPVSPGPNVEPPLGVSPSPVGMGLGSSPENFSIFCLAVVHFGTF